MLLHLTDLSDESLQDQIKRQIRAKILTGELPAGSSLPSIRALARDNHVSVITVQRAYEYLMHEDLIHSRRGKGFFVSEVPDQEKKKLSKSCLYENIKKPIRSALAEGLTKTEVKNTVNQIFENGEK